MILNKNIIMLNRQRLPRYAALAATKLSHCYANLLELNYQVDAIGVLGFSMK